jgi:hypothetical protein
MLYFLYCRFAAKMQYAGAADRMLYSLYCARMLRFFYHRWR